MGVRGKGRACFECLGERFYWYQDDWRVHVSSEDKTFVIAYFIGDPWGDGPHLEVHGQRFPGLEVNKLRPVRLCVPNFVAKEWTNSLGAFVNALLRWSLKKSHCLKVYEFIPPNEAGG